jgi:hypothetical protein
MASKTKSRHSLKTVRSTAFQGLFSNARSSQKYLKNILKKIRGLPMEQYYVDAVHQGHCESHQLDYDCRSRGTHCRARQTVDGRLISPAVWPTLFPVHRR